MLGWQKCFTIDWQVNQSANSRGLASLKLVWIKRNDIWKYIFMSKQQRAFLLLTQSSISQYQKWMSSSWLSGVCFPGVKSWTGILWGLKSWICIPGGLEVMDFYSLGFEIHWFVYFLWVKSYNHLQMSCFSKCGAVISTKKAEEGVKGHWLFMCLFTNSNSAILIFSSFEYGCRWLQWLVLYIRYASKGGGEWCFI